MRLNHDLHIHIFFFRGKVTRSVTHLAILFQALLWWRCRFLPLFLSCVMTMNFNFWVHNLNLKCVLDRGITHF